MTADEWNDAHPVGTLVSVGPGNFMTCTRSEAWRDAIGRDVVLVKGNGRPQSLSDVTPLPDA